LQVLLPSLNVIPSEGDVWQSCNWFKFPDLDKDCLLICSTDPKCICTIRAQTHFPQVFIFSLLLVFVSGCRESQEYWLTYVNEWLETCLYFFLFGNRLFFNQSGHLSK
jgi:hypothetical protein